MSCEAEYGTHNLVHAFVKFCVNNSSRKLLLKGPKYEMKPDAIAQSPMQITNGSTFHTMKIF